MGFAKSTVVSWGGQWGGRRVVWLEKRWSGGPSSEFRNFEVACEIDGFRGNYVEIGEVLAGVAGYREIEGVEFDFEAEIATSSYIAVAEAVAS